MDPLDQVRNHVNPELVAESGWHVSLKRKLPNNLNSTSVASLADSQEPGAEDDNRVLV